LLAERIAFCYNSTDINCLLPGRNASGIMENKRRKKGEDRSGVVLRTGKRRGAKGAHEYRCGKIRKRVSWME